MILSRPKGRGWKRQNQFFLLLSSRPQGGRRGPELKYRPETSQLQGGAPTDRSCSLEGQRRHKCPLSKTQQGERSWAVRSSGMTSWRLRSEGFWEWKKGQVGADGQDILRGQRWGQRSRGIQMCGSQWLAVTTDSRDSFSQVSCAGAVHRIQCLSVREEEQGRSWGGVMASEPSVFLNQQPFLLLHRIAFLVSAPQNSNPCSGAPRRWLPIHGQPATTYVFRS